MFMKSRPSEFTPAMLAARTPDAVPNHPGSANVQRTNVCPLPQCSPCTLPPCYVYSSPPLTTTLPRPSVTSVPHTHPPTQFATPHASSPGTEDSPYPPPQPSVLLDAFSLLYTTSPLPHTTFPLRTLALLPPTPSLLLNHRTIQTEKIPPLRPSCALLPPHPYLLTLAPPMSC